MRCSAIQPRFRAPLHRADDTHRPLKFDGMDAPSPAACAIMLHEPNEERTSQVSILGKAEFLASRAGRVRCVSPVPQPFESVALPGATGEVHRGGLRQLPGPGEARPRGQVVAAASNPSSSVNDAADADAEAASRPTFVAVKTEEQQGWQARSLAAADGASRSRVRHCGSARRYQRQEACAAGVSRATRCIAADLLQQGFEREDRRATGRPRRKTRTRG